MYGENIGGGMGGGQLGCVTRCIVTECGFNSDMECRAPGVQVGDMHPACDTFTTMGGSEIELAGPNPDVVTCKAVDCEYNLDMDCNAQQGILVDRHSDHADCATYEAT